MLADDRDTMYVVYVPDSGLPYTWEYVKQFAADPFAAGLEPTDVEHWKRCGFDFPWAPAQWYDGPWGGGVIFGFRPRVFTDPPRHRWLPELAFTRGNMGNSFEMKRIPPQQRPLQVYFVEPWETKPPRGDVSSVGLTAEHSEFAGNNVYFAVGTKSSRQTPPAGYLDRFDGLEVFDMKLSALDACPHPGLLDIVAGREDLAWFRLFYYDRPAGLIFSAATYLAVWLWINTNKVVRRCHVVAEWQTPMNVAKYWHRE